MTPPIQSNSSLGRGQHRTQALGLIFCCAAAAATAAPLDAFLSATPELYAPKGVLEVGSDHMNEQLDFFRIRDTNALAAGTQAGDYHGAHVAGAWRMMDNAWLSGSLWQRRISGLSESYNFSSWQVAGQYRLLDGAGKLPALALRLSAWGNQAGDVGSSFAANAGVQALMPAGFLLQSIKVSQPADHNLQADLVGSWKLTPTTDVGVLLSAGSTRLSFDQLSGSVLNGGKVFQFAAIGNPSTVATAADGSQVLANTSKINVTDELAWRGNFLQAGINTAWNHGPWTLRAGYLWYAVQREGIDDVLAARGWSSYSQTRTIALEANYRIRPNLSIFARSQLSDTLIFNEMPVLYNTFSADLNGGKYSIYSVGLKADF
ncbi:MAG: hypothetical protein AUJ20_04225 [Comamonadaceae bacterium CG1_02_60_18]|nr:MAG: hypothetical protein AUJ20_04225 [Comamonadaceae bacterium CG1_02_60_18]PIQ52581.1 MAG: hypothetical protein COW02_09795 [Comamonadaceae bacterium CG12_big_fil_rev_8_21_14_0_65_59_15]